MPIFFISIYLILLKRFKVEWNVYLAAKISSYNKDFFYDIYYSTIHFSEIFTTKKILRRIYFSRIYGLVQKNIMENCDKVGYMLPFSIQFFSFHHNLWQHKFFPKDFAYISMQHKLQICNYIIIILWYINRD